jgi:hypothetical protein
MIRLRWVHSHDPISDGIILQTGGEYSHVEALTPEGTYIGAHIHEGVAEMPGDYDEAIKDRELIVNLPAPPAMELQFYHYLRACIGEPYDFHAIAGFILHWDIHAKHKVICSALQTLALRGCGWFATPLAVPAHEISPRDLLLIVSGRVPLPSH